MKLSEAEAKTLGIPTGKARFGTINRKRDKDRKKDDNQSRDRLFDAMCKSHGLPLPVTEYPFAKEIGRKWAFDYLFEGWLAVEKEGGTWVGGRHVQGQGFENDIEKYNTAALMGYVVLRFLPEQFNDGSAMAFIKRVLEAKEEQP